jgi:hypothetical protein
VQLLKCLDYINNKIMEKISINKNILSYRGDNYEIASYEIINEEFVHINTENMTIALLPNDTEINGILVTTIEEIINIVIGDKIQNINNLKTK